MRFIVFYPQVLQEFRVGWNWPVIIYSRLLGHQQKYFMKVYNCFKKGLKENGCEYSVFQAYVQHLLESKESSQYRKTKGYV